MASTALDTLTRSKRAYHHFCPAARALETIGERWSLLIVRDLLAGPRRFSDLRRSLAAITPKWLSARLRALESDGIVTREVTGEREVWYRLTPKGQALEPVFDALARLGDGSCAGTPARRGSDSSRAGDGRDRAIPRGAATGRGAGSHDVGVPLRRGSQLHDSLRRRPLDTTARGGRG
jgi:DNA-binding HxlR family transcriptional regulator